MDKVVVDYVKGMTGLSEMEAELTVARLHPYDARLVQRAAILHAAHEILFDRVDDESADACAVICDVLDEMNVGEVLSTYDAAPLPYRR